MRGIIPQEGFTLVELMVTIAVMAIIALMAAPSMSNLLESKRLDANQRETLKERELLRQILVYLVLWEKQTDKLIVYHLVLVLIRMEPLIQIKKTRAGFKQKLVVTVQLESLNVIQMSSVQVFVISHLFQKEMNLL